jgi:hypothetical protein
MRPYSKKIKRLIREYMAEAYERELHRELIKLDQSMTEWREGKISNGELSHRIHLFEVGPSRELFKQYNDSPADMNVSYAIVAGLVKKNEVPTELLEAISGPMAFYQLLKDRGELKAPGE